MKAVYLRTRREQLELTQEALERRSNVAQNTISKLETRRGARPIFITVVALARALDVDPLALRFGPDPARRPRAKESPDERSAVLHPPRTPGQAPTPQDDVSYAPSRRKAAVSRGTAAADRPARTVSR